MEKKKRNWIAWIALGLSLIAIGISAYSINYHPISLKEPDLNWILGTSISVMSIAVTIILGIQIYTIITIDKRVQKKLEEERDKYKDENIKLKVHLKAFTIAVQRFTSGNIYLSNEEYNDAFCVFCLAAIDANKINEKELVFKSLEQAINLLNYGKYINKCDVIMKYMEEIKEGMINIPDKRAIYIYNSLSHLPSLV